MMRKILIFFLTGALFLLFNTSSVQAVNSITNINLHKTTVGQYDKLEADFDLIGADFDNPYYYYGSGGGIDGITVDAYFTSPSGQQITVPAFWQVPYQRLREGNSEVLGITGQGSWLVRFAPSQTGTYRLHVKATDKNGSAQSESKTFNVVASNKKGFVRASSRDPRFFEFDNGQSFIPFSGTATWMGTAKGSYHYDDLFDQWSQYGLNFGRIWDQNDGYNLTLEGTYPAWFNDI